MFNHSELILRRGVGLAVGFLALLYSSSGWAETGTNCPRNYVEGKENIDWHITWDFKSGKHIGKHKDGEVKTADIVVMCSEDGRISVSQSRASDKNDCNYSGIYKGDSVSGIYFCRIAPGEHKFSGTFLTR
jgi:hypothetical protein